MYDLVIVGGGIAGMCAALRAPATARVVVVDKGEAGAGSSPLAQGGLAAAVGPDDSPDLHAADTIAAGAGICDEALVKDVCAEGPEAISWLGSRGCEFDRAEDGSLDLAREGGQTVARSVHWRDATGAAIVRALREAIRGRVVERVVARASELLVHDGRCAGVLAEDRVYLGRATLLATGGAGGLWGATTNAPGATGDGIALAIAAGVQVADLEFMQFHPTALADGPLADGVAPTGASQRILLTEALRGEGAILVDDRGERFVDELGPRHVVAKAILDRGGAFLDCRPVESLVERFPTVIDGARACGFDPVTEPLPVFPAAHYFIGGVAADAYGRTSLPGLFAAGECAATGMHGANRLAGNSLLETVVVGGRVGAQVATEPFPAAPERVAADLVNVGPGVISEPDPALPAIVWTGAGPIRDDESLRAAIESLGALAPSSHRDLCAMIARAARARAESRGVHIRSDYPAPDPSFAARSFDQASHRMPH